MQRAVAVGTSSRTDTGFTLIEVIVVLMLAGTLAALAAPRFVDLRDEAEQSSFDAISTRFNSAVRMVHALAQSSGASTQVTLSGGVPVDLSSSGYPAVDQTDSHCNTVALHNPVPDSRILQPQRYRFAVLRMLIGEAHAIPPPPPPPGDCDLPKLILIGDLDGWTWTVSGSQATFESPDGQQLTYDETTGQVSTP